MRHQRARIQFSSEEENDSENETCSVLPPFPKLKQSEVNSSPRLLKRDSEKRTIINYEVDLGTPKRKRENEASSHKRIAAIESFSTKNLHTQEDSPLRTENGSNNGNLTNNICF